jgi:hypothetical protein
MDNFANNREFGMKMWRFLGIVCLSLALAGCAWLPTRITTPAPTPTILATSTPLLLTETPPHATVTQILSTETPALPYLFVDEAMIVRSGPGESFPVTTQIPSQQRYPVIGKNGIWWLVDLGAGNRGWVYAPVYITNFVGEAAQVPDIVSPPNPTMQPTPTCASPLPATPEPTRAIAEARKALITYFERLNARDYAAAADLYTGDYEGLRVYNPLVDPANHAGLFKNACEINGHRCQMTLRVVSESQLSAAEFQFTVEFMNPDGSLFVLGACCGGDDVTTPSQSRFIYTVLRSCSVKYSVLELPVYTP